MSTSRLFKQKLGQKPKIIVIVGPTTSGKSHLAVKISRKFKGEIISADSRQVYKGMDIGTAKPTKAEIQSIPHHLIDIKNPNQNYTLAEYKKDCLKKIKKILQRNNLPIIVGGTGLYIKAVVDNLDIPPASPNSQLRKKLEKELKEKGLPHLYEKLISLDPEAAYIIDKNNPRRIIRALEITIITNKPFSLQRKQGQPLFNALKIGINLPKEKLKNKIRKRTGQMIKNGLVNEVEALIKKYNPSLTVFDAIGYREIINYLNGKITLSEAVELIKRSTWRYAKRQMTWFRKDKEIIWASNEKEALILAKKFLGN
ncbi:tRNA (adenosine(37)-N6)-dimethylallyltransferase MiaA [Candidatus Wolfebacteria bacterium RIFCSPLOWO2_01_FULL_38_11]|uniref:tRNA dimethylallyltransferase n=1 Tax=Candidatus Wolfebacteria bacterium RIFCSPLOWO2_01_FULL_38_11 TaxID=1802556 RepID=A0A1F8DQ20_9BACT|nr:MAG: tRNA (adenosine(37)-N6)-dimethylallyltransferase MiaA [Candidatus Wolfebacteria bacterium RIFCSPLOWO2_01_FULL_38_11]